MTVTPAVAEDLSTPVAGTARSSGITRPSRLIRFVLPNLPLAALGLPLGVYLPEYFGAYVGLSLATVGLAFFLVRSIDIGFDPLMGVVLDRTKTRWGQCRPWLIIGALLIMIGVPFLFWAPPGASAVRLVAGLLILYAGTSIVSLAHSAWATRLASDYYERSKVWAWIQIVGSLGAFMIIAMPMVGGIFGGFEKGQDVQLMGLLIMILMPLALLLAMWGIPEPPVPRAHEGRDSKVRIRDYLVLLVRPPIARITIADAVIAVAQGTTSVLFLFFWMSAREYTAAQVSLLITCYMLGGFLGVPVWVRVAKLVGKHRALMIALLGYVFIIPAAGMLPPGNIYLVAPLQLALGLSFAAGSFLLRSMASDAGDEVRLHTGVDRLGQIYALLASTQKLGSAISVGATYWILERAGFNAALGVNNDGASLTTLEFLYIGLPGVLMFVGMLVFWGYRLDKGQHDSILEALALKDAQRDAIP